MKLKSWIFLDIYKVECCRSCLSVCLFFCSLFICLMLFFKDFWKILIVLVGLCHDKRDMHIGIDQTSSTLLREARRLSESTGNVSEWSHSRSRSFFSVRGSNLCSADTGCTVSGLLVSLLVAEQADWNDVAGLAAVSEMKGIGKLVSYWWIQGVEDKEDK